jgi:hypothetical protein
VRGEGRRRTGRIINQFGIKEESLKGYQSKKKTELGLVI